MKKYSYLKAVVIVHGKSEKQICQHIKQKLRLRIEIESDKNGEKSIQITSLNKLLNNKKFKSKTAFLRNFPYIELDESGKDISPDFKIFIIMDTDDCTKEQEKQFINKEMFKEHWAYDYIKPIYNSPELETVLEKAKVPFKKIGDKRKKEYIKLFPTDSKYEKSDVIQIDELLNNLSTVRQTNLDEFLKFCLDNFQ